MIIRLAKMSFQLPEYVEAHADRLRLHFAEFIDQVAQTPLNGGTVSELLLIRERLQLLVDDTFCFH